MYVTSCIGCPDSLHALVLNIFFLSFLSESIVVLGQTVSFLFVTNQFYVWSYCISQLFITVTKIPDKNDLEEQSLFGAYGVRGSVDSL